MSNINKLLGQIVTISKYLEFKDYWISYPAKITDYHFDTYYFHDKNENIILSFYIELLDDFDYYSLFDGFNEDDYIDLYEDIYLENIYKSNLTKYF
jgi:hypothetical protein